MIRLVLSTIRAVPARPYHKLRSRIVLPTRAVVLRKVASLVCRRGLVADLGCAFGTTLSQTLRSCSGRNRIEFVGVDLFLPALAEGKSSGQIECPVMADLRALPIASKSVDVSLLVDVIEHFDANQVEQVVAEAKRISKHTVVVVTPQGLLEQGEADGNPWQRHRSYWHAHDLHSMGFTVTGADVSLDFVRHKLGVFGGLVAPVGELLLAGLGVFPARWSTMLFATMSLKPREGNCR